MTRFNGCDDLLEYVHTEYADRISPWDIDPDGWIMLGGKWHREEHVDFDADDFDTEDFDAENSGESMVEGIDYSGTNVQEASVDEADVVKTDGEHIFALSNGRLMVVDITSRRVIGQVEVAGDLIDNPYYRSAEVGLFISGDGLVLIQHHKSSRKAKTVLQRISLDGTTPVIVDTLRIEGHYVSAHSIDGTVSMVLTSTPHTTLPFVDTSGDDYKAAKKAARSAVLDSTLDDWLPSYTHDTADHTGSPRQLIDCENAHAPSVFSGFGITTVMSVPIEGDFHPTAGSTAVMVPGNTVYASAESLYLATTIWNNPEDRQNKDEWLRTSIHRFDITDTAGAVYKASGDVPGYVHNQFSLSEYDGHLRMVTTNTVSIDRSQVLVLRQDGTRLSEVGRVDDIGRGERVKSVRFVGDIGYVVTFRQIDPFYTIDLSDPTDPVIRGELKIPGFSSYLHPISNTLILGVGSDTDEEGRVTGSKVSLFNVSDLDNPRETAVWTTPYGWNDVGWDHHAFLWWAPADLAIIPVTTTDNFMTGDFITDDFMTGDFMTGDSWSEVVVLRVTEHAITELGRIDHGGAYKLDWTDAGWVDAEGYSGNIVRSIVIGDELWTLSYEGAPTYLYSYSGYTVSSIYSYGAYLQVNDLNSLEPLDRIRLGN